MQRFLFTLLTVVATMLLPAIDIPLVESASLIQVQGAQVESETLLPMNDLDIEFGYILYQCLVTITSSDALLEVESIRDYASVFIDGTLQGRLTSESKQLTLTVPPGQYILRLYVENIGRITYGPEILDNSKGLFGNLYIDGEAPTPWLITELKVRNLELSMLRFTTTPADVLPALHRGPFTLTTPHDYYLDITGRGMGEAWVNGHYIGSFWEEEKQQSILVPASLLKAGTNEVVIFDLKNINRGLLRLVDAPVFK